MAERKCFNICILFLVLLIHAVGILLFCKGYLLKRIELHQYSDCSKPSLSTLNHVLAKSTGESCNGAPRRFKKAVWLLIDALRYDFMVYDDRLDPNPPLYRNKMPFVRDLLLERPQNAKLFRIYADPPTTTMQRLKALTTGSLPTFIDVSSNFNSYTILEDSLPNQLRRRNLNTTLLGDDTWLSLYSHLLTKVYDYPSFNVKDLHTVDDGVMHHLLPELAADDADLLVGHFLGVDHCGHIFGPSHPNMASKLTQMNEMLKDVIPEIDEDTILFVFGDHGMTPTGDHGGDSENETSAALLIYSSRSIFCGQEISQRAVSQIDIVPTVSLLLDIPIPYSSLGVVIPELYLKCPDLSACIHQTLGDVKDEFQQCRQIYKGRVDEEFLFVLNRNARQIKNYLDAYSDHSNDFPTTQRLHLQKLLDKAELMHSSILVRREKDKYFSEQPLDVDLREDMEECADLYYNFMYNVRDLCRQLWAKYDDTSIFMGIVVEILATLVTLLLAFNSREDRTLPLVKFHFLLPSIFMGGILSFLCIWYLGLGEPSSLTWSLTEIINWVAELLFIAVNTVSIYITFCLMKPTYAKLCSTLTSLGPCSSKKCPYSYVLAVFALVVMVSYSVTFLSNSFVLYEFSVALYLNQVLLVVFFLYYRHLCVTHASNSRNKRVSQVNFFLILVFMILIIARLSKLFRVCRDLQVDCKLTHFTLSLPAAMEMIGFFGKCVRFLSSSLCVLCVPFCSIWWVWKNSLVNLMSSFQKTFLFLIHPFVSGLVVVHWSLQSYETYASVRLSHFQHVAAARLVYWLSLVCIAWNILAILRIRGNNHSNRLAAGDDVNKTSIIFVSWLLVVLAVWQMLAMILNDALALGGFLMLAHIALYTILTALVWKMEEDVGLDPSVWFTAVCWVVMTTMYFHGTGHEPTVPSIRFEAAFVGMHGEVESFIIAGLLVGFNTLGSQVFHALSIPLLVLWSHSPGKTSENVTRRRLMKFTLQLASCYSLKVFFSLVAASIHRRHLMVWTVFAPRFLFEAVFFGLSQTFVLVVYSIT